MEGVSEWKLLLLLLLLLFHTVLSLVQCGNDKFGFLGDVFLYTLDS